MEPFKVFQMFLIFCLIKPFHGAPFRTFQNFTGRCDVRHANLSYHSSTRAGYSGSFILTLFRDLQNFSVRFILRVPGSPTGFIDQDVNLCSAKKRVQNIFIRLYSDNMLSSNANFTCPLKKGSYVFSERPTEKITETLFSYMPSFVRIRGKVLATFISFFVEKNQKITVCETSEVWVFDKNLKDL